MSESHERSRPVGAATIGAALLAVALLPAGGVVAQEVPEPPRLEFAFEVRAEVADPLVIGELPEGTRRIVDIVGGSVAGAGIAGRIRPGGADWQLIRREDGFTQVDARYTIETDSGSLIYVQNKGIRHAPADTTAMGTSPGSAPTRAVRVSVSVSAIESSSEAPKPACQSSTASMRCHRERAPSGSRYTIAEASGRPS